ncbi:MAG: hypothetical protein CSB55_01370 [Candidatus Cloacimonadota bacterium]|nr:MAG: hypothetical protein CSB55_01370 [Candidatus Cloacimonadota bacterium]
MKRFFYAALIIAFVSCLFADRLSTVERIKKYAGNNAEELLKLYETANNEGFAETVFLLDVCPPADLAVIDAGYIRENIEYALKTKSLAYAKDIPDDVFNHFILPYRVSQEPVSNWRKDFYDEIYPLVKDAKSVEEAAIIVNLWVLEQMTFTQTSRRDQTALTSVRRGFGRCEESMIIYICAARSVGIPARPASVPYWNFTNSNHAWVEVFTAAGWKFLGEAENSLNRAWFSKTAERASLIVSEVQGDYENKDVIKQVDGMTYLSSINLYNDAKLCKIKVYNKDGLPVKDAEVRLYAASFGGIFIMFEIKTDESGEVSLPLGESSIIVSAQKDGLADFKLFNIIKNNEIRLDLALKSSFDDEFIMHFLLADNNPVENEHKEILGEDFYDKREIANLRRCDRIYGFDKSDKFVRYFQLTFPFDGTDAYWERLEKFLDKMTLLAGATDQYLNALKEIKDDIKRCILIEMLESWNIKDLIEMPNEEAVIGLVDIYSSGRSFYPKISDSLFYEYVVNPNPVLSALPQNDWQREFFDQIKHLREKDIKSTKINIDNWLEGKVKNDDNYEWSYFTASLNPLQMLNMRNIPLTCKKYVIYAALNLLSVPVRWRGRLEYWNGENFEVAVKADKESEELEYYSLKLKMRIDGEYVTPVPGENFLIGAFDENGIYYTYFDGEAKDDVFTLVYGCAKNQIPVAEAFIRNDNGDADVRLISLNKTENEKLTVDLNTPKEHVQVSYWDENYLSDFLEEFDKNDTTAIIYYISSDVSSEPQIRMFDQIMDNNKLRSHLKIAETGKKSLSVPKDIETRLIAADKLPVSGNEHFPLIIMTDKNKNIIFSSEGYDAGISKLLERKVDKLK